MRHSFHYQHGPEVGLQRLGQRLLVSSAFRAIGAALGQEPARAAALPAAGSAAGRRGNTWRTAAGVSLLLHAALIVSFGLSATPFALRGQADPPARAERAWLHARLRAPTPVTPPAPAAVDRPAAPPLPEARPIPAAAPPAGAAPPESAPAPDAPDQTLPPPAAGDPTFGLLPGEIPQAAPPPEPVYYGPREVDTRAVPIAAIQPHAEQASRVPVTIRLEIYVSAAGTVDKVEVLSTIPPDQPTAFAERAFREARFAPAQLNGQAVASKKTIEMVLEPN